MADEKKISQLPFGGAIEDNDTLVGNQGFDTVRQLASAWRAYVLAGLPDNLKELGEIVGAANTFPLFTGLDQMSSAAITAQALVLLGESSYSDMRDTLGVTNAISANRGATSKVHFSVTKATGTTQSIPSAVATKVLFYTESVDVGSGFDLPNSKFVAPVAGNYLFHFQVGITSGAVADTITAQLYRNGVRHTNGAPSSNPAFPAGLASGSSALMTLAQGDTVEVYAFLSAAAARNTNDNTGNCYLNGVLLS